MEIKGGQFVDSLKRNYKQIREDRAQNITEDAEQLYRRKVEDLEREITRIKRDRDALLDISPGTTTSLTFPQFDPNEFVKKDSDMGLRLRDLQITLELDRARYKELFVMATEAKMEGE